MQGKSCFNFRSHDEPLFEELERRTGKGIHAFRRAGFITAEKPASAALGANPAH